ncbi:MAG: type III pantothenate kinase [Candidatus Margulisbacteria bacterium]|nr:type III pantothenate kinase [Candidatus Margulisiibacteriota bacterium]
MKSKILTIDAGNTTVSFGLFEGKKLVRAWHVPTGRITGGRGTRDWGLGTRQIIISSVVPKVSKILKKTFPGALFVNHKNIGIKVRVAKPAQVGADRLVDALAAYKLYGGPAIVVDFGTATTFDVINARGDYLGGAIAPGILLARDTLYERTAKLPKIEIKAPKNVIGKNTVEAMRSGLVYGYAALVEGMIKRIISKFEIRNSKFKVIATGGLALLICKQTDVIDIIDQGLTLKGLRMIGEMR